MTGTKKLKWKMYAHRNKTHYSDFGKKQWVKLFGLPESIVPVILTEDKDGQYWGWIDTGKDTPCMIQPSNAQFSMCFAYGYKAEVELGRGKVIRLKVKEVIQ